MLLKNPVPRVVRLLPVLQGYRALAARTQRRALSSRLTFLPLLVPIFLALNGCWLVGGSQGESAKQSPTIPSQSPTIPSRSLKPHSVQEKPEYQEAAKAFTSGDKAGALRSLEALRATAGLGAADQAFLDRQIAICQGKTVQSQGKTVQGQAPIARSAKAIDPNDKSVSGLGDCGPRALTIAANELGVKAGLAAVAKASGTTADGTTLEGLVKGAKSLGLKAVGVQVDRDALAQLPTPAIAWWEGNHFVAVLKVSENPFTGEVFATIHDPNNTKPESVKLADLLAKSGGIFLTLKK